MLLGICNPDARELTLIQLIRKLRRLKDEKCVHVHLFWVPGHADGRVPGNEVADREAKNAVGEGELLDSGYLYTQQMQKTKARNVSLRNWNNEWQYSRNGRFTNSLIRSVGDKTIITKVKTCPHGELRWLMRVLSGHLPTNSYLCRFNLLRDKACVCGELEESIEHLLLRCPRFGLQRLGLCLELGKGFQDLTLQDLFKEESANTVKAILKKRFVSS